MPGISPRIAISRSLLRPRPNLRNTPRARPVSAQRLRWRTGLALRGSCCSFRRASKRSSSDRLALLMTAINCSRLAANLATSLARLSSRLISASFAMLLTLERELERSQQRAGFFVSFSGSGDGDVHPAQRIDLVVLDFREDDLLTHTHVVVTATVKGLAVDATEITHARQRDGDQAIQEFVHALAAQGHLAADRVAITNLEAGDRLAGSGHHRFLTGDFLHVANGVFQNLFVRHSFAHTHVQGDLFDARDFHDGFVTKLFHQFGHNGAFVVVVQTCHVHSLSADNFAVRFEHANLAAIFQQLEANTIGFLGCRDEESHVGNINRHGFFNNTALNAFNRVRLLVFLHHVDAFDDQFAVEDAQHGATLAFVFAGENDNVVTSANLLHAEPLLTALQARATRSS